jgi:hypothetical protein
MPFGCRTRQPPELDRAQASALPRDSNDEPGSHRCIFNRSRLVVARRDLCGAMARLID